MEWNNTFATGIKQFDRDHKRLVSLLNKSYDDFIFGAPDDNVGIVLNELVSYAGYHFTAEEVWMQENSYPKLAEHKNEHDNFTQNVKELQTGFNNGKGQISLDVLTFLKRWIRNHMLETDAGLGVFLNSKSKSSF